MQALISFICGLHVACIITCCCHSILNFRSIGRTAIVFYRKDFFFCAPACFLSSGSFGGFFNFGLTHPAITRYRNSFSFYALCKAYGPHGNKCCQKEKYFTCFHFVYFIPKVIPWENLKKLKF